MLKSSSDSVILVYGGGGHHEQMKRLLKGLEDYNESVIKFVSICNSDVKIPLTEDFYVVRLPLFKKNLFEFYKVLVQFPRLIKTLWQIIKNYKFRYVITTGPGIGVLFGIIFKLFGKKVIYIETWSRFYTKSLSGKLGYLFSDYFFVQNKELTEIYKRSIYKGRL